MHSGIPPGGWKFSNIKDDVFAELIHVSDANGNLAHLPERVSLEVGAMFSDMATTGFHGVELASIEPGGVVAVIGISPVGLMPMASASVLGVGRLFAVGSRSKCTEVVQEFGATDIVNYREGGVVEQIMEVTKDQGVNRVIVVGGDLDTFQQAFDVLEVGSWVADVNYLGKGENVKTSRESAMVDMGHKHFVGGPTPSGHNHMDRKANLVPAGRTHPGKMTTHRFTEIEHVEDGVELMHTELCDFVKPVILA